jgi:hypothetical protein
MTFLFILFYIFAVLVCQSKIDEKKRKYLLLSLILVVAILVGFRDPFLWSDSGGYVVSFDQFTNTLSSFSFNDRPAGYTEMGFYLLSSIIKSFTDNSTIYLLIISILTCLFLYKFADQYCMFPLIGFCVYMGRFLPGRNMIQIRAALAIAIIICGTGYITKQKMWKFLLVILLAYTLHHSSIIILPVYFMNKLNIKKSYIVIGLIVAFVLAGFYGGTIKHWVSTSDFINDMASSYVREGSDKAWSNNLSNPIIYYQCAILLTFTFYEKRLSKLTSHYFTIRNAYFYSTLLLIILCQYGVIAGRTSTIFATYEMMMVPMFIMLFHKNGRIIPYLGIGLVSATFFYYNYKPAIAILINQ